MGGTNSAERKRMAARNMGQQNQENTAGKRSDMERGKEDGTRQENMERNCTYTVVETAAMEWSEEKCYQLISVYQKHELLWQQRHPQHYNKLKKQVAWKEIAQEIKTDPEECKKKMGSLLSSFRRENTKIKRSRGTGRGRDSIYETSWFAFKAMIFLQDKDEHMPGLNTLLRNDNSDSSEEREVPPADTVLPPLVVENLDRMPAPSKSPIQKRRKRINADRLDKAFSMLQASASVASLRNEENEHDIFGRLVAKKLQRYSPDVSSIVQEQLMKTLFKADRGWYNIDNQHLPPIQYPSQISSDSNLQNYQQPQPSHYNPNSNSSHSEPPNPNIPLSVTPDQTTPPA